MGENLEGLALVANVKADGYRAIIDLLLDENAADSDVSSALMELEVLDGLSVEGAMNIMNRVSGMGYDLLRDCPQDKAFFAICGGGLVTA